MKTAQRVGRGTAVQRDAERAHAHAQARGHRARRSRRARLRRRGVPQGHPRRLYKLDPFRYQLVDIPFKFHHPMWRENCEVDLDYHVRPYRVDSPGGRRELDEAVGRDRQHAAGPQPPAVGDVLHRGAGRRPDRGARQDPPRAGRRRRLGESAGARDGSADGAAGRPGLLCHRPGAEPSGAGAHGVRRPHAPDGPHPGRDALHRPGARSGAAELAQAVARADPAVHPAADAS